MDQIVSDEKGRSQSDRGIVKKGAAHAVARLRKNVQEVSDPARACNSRNSDCVTGSAHRIVGLPIGLTEADVKE